MLRRHLKLVLFQLLLASTWHSVAEAAKAYEVECRSGDARLAEAQLQSSSVIQRRGGLELVQRHGLASLSRHVVRIIESAEEDPQTRELAIEALRAAAPSTAAGVLVPLIGKRGEPDSVRGMAIRGSAALRNWRAIPAMLRVIDADNESKELRLEAVRGMEAFASLQLGATLMKMAADPKAPPELRVAAIDSFSRAGDSDALPLLVRLLDDPDEEVKRAALDALGNIPRTFASFVQMAPIGLADYVPKLLAIYESSTVWAQRKAAINALVRAEQASALAALAKLLEKEQAADAQRALITAIAQFPGQPSIGIVTREAEREVDPSVSSWAIVSLGTLLQRSKATSLPAVIRRQAASQSDSAERRAAVHALGMIPSPEAGALLAALIVDEKRSDAQRALLLEAASRRQLSDLGAAAERRITHLVQSGGGRTAELRAAAIHALKLVPEARPRERLLAYALNREENALVRDAALQLLDGERLEAKETIVVKVLAQEEPQERSRSALLRLLAHGGPDARRSLRDLITDTRSDLRTRRQALELLLDGTEELDAADISAISRLLRGREFTLHEVIVDRSWVVQARAVRQPNVIEILDALLQVAAQCEVPRPIRLKAISVMPGLAGIVSSARVESRLVAIVENEREDDEVRLAAASALARFDTLSQASIGALWANADRKEMHSAIRAASVEAVAKTAQRSPVVSQLLLRLVDTERRGPLREAALRSLRFYVDEEPVFAKSSAILGSSSEDPASRAAAAAVLNGNFEGRKVLLEASRSEKDIFLQRVIRANLADPTFDRTRP